MTIFSLRNIGRGICVGIVAVGAMAGLGGVAGAVGGPTPPAGGSWSDCGSDDDFADFDCVVDHSSGSGGTPAPVCPQRPATVALPDLTAGPHIVRWNDTTWWFFRQVTDLRLSVADIAYRAMAAKNTLLAEPETVARAIRELAVELGISPYGGIDDVRARLAVQRVLDAYSG
jgi:hypothetical protein